ncbi:MAG: AraC family transcriptional regulator [Clostridia bacterium]|nr:AraC family transcriptional regulator [Clostridia bacterium]
MLSQNTGYNSRSCKRLGCKMSNWSNLSTIIENATLDILQFDVHHRTSLEYRNRSLPFYIVSYVKEGTCRVRFKGQDYYAGPGDVVFLPPNVVHDHVKDSGDLTIFIWWHFTYRIAGVLDVLNMFEFPVCFKLPDAERFEETFSQYVRCSANPKTISDIIMKEAKAFELIAILLESAISHAQISHNNLISNTFTHILEDIIRYPERNGFLKDLAKKYHMHPTYISNRFKKLFNISPIQFQKEIRISKAKKLLMTESLSVTEIAEKLGYEDVDDFTRFFKKREGVSPLKFKRHFGKFKNESPLSAGGCEQ